MCAYNMRAPGLERGRVLAVAQSSTHGFPKNRTPKITLVAGKGVLGDSHTDAPHEVPNLRQVHFIASELQQELCNAGIELAPGSLGDNVATSELDVMHVPLDTVLKLGDSAQVRITGCRNPCKSLEKQYPGVTKKMLYRESDSGELVRKTGIFGVVEVGGEVCEGDTIEVSLPAEPHKPLPVL